MYIQRHLEDQIKEASKYYPVVLVCGQRQVGKSTMLNHMKEEYYYRDIDGKEIDLLFIEGDKIYPVEIKKAKMPNHADKNFSVLEKLKMDIQPGVILCMADEMLPYSRETWFFPAAAI